MSASEPNAIAPRELLQIAPPGVQVERVSDADRMLLIRVEAQIAGFQRAAQELQGFVSGHLSAVYKLQPGDKIEDDGTIVRAAPPAEAPAQ